MQARNGRGELYVDRLGREINALVAVVAVNRGVVTLGSSDDERTLGDRVGPGAPTPRKCEKRTPVEAIKSPRTVVDALESWR